MAQPTAAPLSRTIELRVTGQPDVPNQYGSGHIRPTEVTFRYQAGGIRAQVYGRWIREDGELTDAPITRGYTAHQGDMTGWPDWLTTLADEQQPAVQQPRRGDAFERWLKARRDEHRDTGRGVWTTLDNLLDTYRLHADTGTPLGEHVCEGQAVGDCECLEVKQ